ncbi:unnamed protein product [Caenorhabditis nigoni]
MSDSSKSVQKSFKKSTNFGEKEPKEEVFSDDEPARKRSKNSTNSGNLQDSSEISVISKKLEDSKNVIEEVVLWVKKLEKLHDEDIDSLKKSTNDSVENLRQEFAEKAKEDREKLKQEFAEKINKMEKNYESKIAELQSAHEKKAEEFEKFRKKMEISGKLSISYKAGDTLYGKPSIVMSDNAKIPPTKSELEFLFKCIFCKSEDHKSIDCRVIAGYTQRVSKLYMEKRCLRCLKPEFTGNSSHICPRSLVACSNCVIPRKPVLLRSAHLHHPIVCPFNDQSPLREARRQARDQHRIKSGLKPRFP